MNWLGFVKAILPTKRIAAWILGLLCAVVALVMGVSGTDIKTQFCASDDVVNLPPLPDKAPIPPPAPAPAQPPAAPKK